MINAKWPLFIILTLLVSCGNFIDNIHRQMDRDRGVVSSDPSAARNQAAPEFDIYRNRRNIGQQQRPSTSSNQTLEPSVKRYYQTNQPDTRRRYRADDLLDNSSQGSLWAGTGNENYLFSSDKIRKVGDIILIDVQGKLKNEITMELKRAFPPPIPMKKDPNAPATAPAAAPAQPGNPAAVGENPEDATLKEDETVYDRFTSLIIEEIDRKHVLIKAQKNVLYNKRKRLIEVQALVSRADIRPDDSVSSNSFLETTIEVLK